MSALTSKAANVKLNIKLQLYVSFTPQSADLPVASFKERWWPQEKLEWGRQCRAKVMFHFHISHLSRLVLWVKMNVLHFVQLEANVSLTRLGSTSALTDRLTGRVADWLRGWLQHAKLLSFMQLLLLFLQIMGLKVLRNDVKCLVQYRGKLREFLGSIVCAKYSLFLQLLDEKQLLE